MTNFIFSKNDKFFIFMKIKNNTLLVFNFQLFMNIEEITKNNFDRCKKIGKIDNNDDIKYVYNYFFDVDKYKKRNTTKINVINSDTLDFALSLSENTLLLNMANPEKIGGNLHIVGSQEEDLFRRTDLCLHLIQEFYPLNSACTILSKNVRVFSKGLRYRYEELQELKAVNIISCAAINNKNLGQYLSFKETTLIIQKIKTIFQVAAINEFDNVVLSAFGCGGFNCHPEQIANIFKKVIFEFKGCFDNIIFAIFDENYPKSNFAIFKNILT